MSFTRAVLLGGLDAPTGGQAQTNPQPVLLRLADHAFLPNRFRGAVKECLVIGAGYGDISAERAYIRTENLSCVRHDGRTLEVKIHGSIFGEDGKVGVRGRLVSKQGQILANALTAGVVSGIGQAFQSRRHHHRPLAPRRRQRHHRRQGIRGRPRAPASVGRWIAWRSTTSPWPRRPSR